MKHLLIVIIALFAVSGCVPTVSTPDHAVDNPDHTIPREEPGYVPSGYIQYCRDFPKSVVCETEAK